MEIEIPHSEVESATLGDFDGVEIRWHFAGGAELPLRPGETLALWTENRGLRGEIFEALICRGKKRARVSVNGEFLDGAGITRLRKLTGVCRTPPAWMPRESVLDSFKLALRMRNENPDPWRITEVLEQVGYFDWKARPSLELHPEQINDNYSRALALTRLLLSPFRIYVLDNPLHAQEWERRDLLMDIIRKIYDTDGIKIYMADKPENIPPFLRNVRRIMACPEKGFRFDESTR